MGGSECRAPTARAESFTAQIYKHFAPLGRKHIAPVLTASSQLLRVLLEPIVRSFFRDDHIVHMTFTETGDRLPDKRGLLL